MNSPSSEGGTRKHFVPTTPASLSFQTPTPNRQLPKQWNFLSYASTISPSPSARMLVVDRSTISTPTTSGALGYLAFPPDGSSLLIESSTQASEEQAEQEIRQQEVERQKKENADREAAWASRLERDAERHRQRVELEEAEALKGEELWVRMGGILRDKEGNRDWARTEEIREELKLREIEEALVSKWKTYEAQWKALLETRGPLRFGDIPWPVDSVIGLEDLGVRKVEEFLLRGLKVRGCTVTKKERIRSSMLRWHPDKMTGVVSRVSDDDLQIVKEGIRAVLEGLQQLSSES